MDRFHTTFMSLPTPRELRASLPLITQPKQVVHDNRLLLIVGPCSVHSEEGLLLYAERLKLLSDQIKNQCQVVLRAHLEKPRTSLGWKGFALDPHLDGSEDIPDGIFRSRRLLLKLIEIGLPISTELLTPSFAPYISDLLSYGVIGARTSASQTHRVLASDMPFPVAFKNRIDGDVDSAIQGMKAAKSHHNYLQINDDGLLSTKRTLGNPTTDLILRGGGGTSNADVESILYYSNRLENLNLNNQVIIDCGHGNSEKKPDLQKRLFIESIEELLCSPLPVKGFMLESYLNGGRSDNPDPFTSLTDPCLSWSETEQILLWAADALSRNFASILP